MATTDYIYKMRDTKSGIYADLTIDGKTYNLSLRYFRGMNNTRDWEVKGNFPADKYSISYEGGKLIVLRKGGDYEVGQKINHKAFGEGVITSINGNMIGIDFNGTTKAMMKSILANFLA